VVRRLRTFRRRVAAKKQFLCALGRAPSAGSPLTGLPLTRFLAVTSVAIAATLIVGARGSLLGEAFPLGARGFRIHLVIHVYGVDNCGRARRPRPSGGNGWRGKRVRRSHAQR